MSQLYFKINLNKYGELRRKIEKDRIVFRNTALVFFIVTALLYAICGVTYLQFTREAHQKSGGSDRLEYSWGMFTPFNPGPKISVSLHGGQHKVCSKGEQVN